MSIVGLDVGKASVVACPIRDSLPDDLARFARTYKPIKLQASREAVSELILLGDVFALEPTGDYSRFWINQLQANNKQVRLVSSRRLKNLRELNEIDTKSDRYDAAFLAFYAHIYKDQPGKFINLYSEDLRTLILRRQTLSKFGGNAARRLWQLLSHEWPEVCRGRSGRRPVQQRQFLQPDPPGLWRFIAGEPIRVSKARTRALNDSIGTGLSELSKTFAAQICDLERQQYRLELEIDELMRRPEFASYREIFRRFGFGPMTEAVLLAQVYPFDQFLGEDGQPIKIKTPSGRSPGRSHRRNKSMGAFKLSLGMGTVINQSGDQKKHRAGGPKWARTALYNHVKMRVVIDQGKGGAVSPRLAEHHRFYRALGPDVPHQKAVMRVAARLSKDLYNDLLSAI